MYQEQRLIYSLNSHSESSFEDLLKKKISPNQAVNDYHTKKKISSPENSQDEADDKLEEHLQEDLLNIKVQLKKQLDNSFDEGQRFIDTKTAEKHLQRLQNNRNPQDLERVKQDILEIRSDLNSRRENVNNFRQILDKNSSIKIKDTTISLFSEAATGNDTEKQKFLAEYLGLSPEKQKAKTKEIEQYINTLNSQYKELLSYLSGQETEKELNKFRNLEKSEREKYLAEVKQISGQYKKLLKDSQISPQTQNLKTKIFNELGLEGKKLLLKNLEEALSPRNQSKLEEFNEAGTARRNKHPDFQLLSSNEKEEVLRTIRAEIKTDFLQKLRSHKFFYAASHNDIATFEGTFQENNGRFEIQKAEMCLKWLDSTMEGIHKQFEEAKKYPKAVLNHFNWDNLNYFERKTLLEKNGQLDKYAEQSENIQLDKKYHDKLTKYLKIDKIGIINAKGFNSYYKWFQSLDVKQKNKIIKEAETNTSLDYLETTKLKRLATNKQFLKLPENTQKEYYDAYIESDFEERSKLIADIKEQSNQLCDEYTEIVDDYIEKKLESPKKRNTYLKWFKNELNISQKNEKIAYFKNKDNKDLVRRKKLILQFTTEIVPLVPAKDLPKIEKKFYNLGQRDRRKYLKKLQDQFKAENQTEEQVNQAKIQAKREAVLENKPLERVQELEPQNNKISIVHKHFLDSAKKFEDRNDRETALKFYREALEIEDIELPKSEQLRITQKINELEGEQIHYERIQEGQFNEIIQTEVENLISTNQTLVENQRVINILDEAYKIQLTNERYYNKAKNAQDVMHDSLEDSYTKEANQAFMDYTGFQSFYVDQYGDLEVGEELEFDINEFDTIENLPYWTDYFSDIQDLPKDAQCDPKLKLISGKTGEVYNAEKFKTKKLDPAKTEFIQNINHLIIDKLDLADNPKLQREVELVIKNMSFYKKLPKTNKDNLAA